MREDLENRKTPLEKAELLDDEDDKTEFEISIVNRHNKALTFEAIVKEGQFMFNKIKVVNDEGIQFTKHTKFDKLKGGRFGRMPSEA